jgi:hypothetical protein
MPNKQFTSLINQHGLQKKNCTRFNAKSTHHQHLHVFVPKNFDITRSTNDETFILVKCHTRERLYLLQEECLLVSDSKGKSIAKYRICGIHPLREGAFGQRISRAVTLVQIERHLY